MNGLKKIVPALFLFAAMFAGANSAWAHGDGHGHGHGHGHWDHRWGHDGWRHHHHGWHGHGPVVVREYRSYYYAPPPAPVYYEPAPVYYYPSRPAVTIGVSVPPIVIPLR